MSKRILVTSTDLMMVQFLIPHVINLSEAGYTIDVACSVVGNRMDDVRKQLKAYVNNIYVIRLKRSPAYFWNWIGYSDLKEIINRESYNYIWTNEPVMGVATRLASQKARKRGTKVVYMVHGFHFYKGCPIKNWILFYPVELLFSAMTDCIVTINREDENRAKHMLAKKVCYLHGIGVNMNRKQVVTEKSDMLRKELGIDNDSFLLLSVGELLPRKNHKVIINALSILADSDIHYAICGQGILKESLTQQADENGILKQIHFLGYRMDVLNLYKQVDAFVFPSEREGLGIAALEAMYYGVPIISSDVSGPNDYMVDGETGYICPAHDAKAFAKAIKSLKENPVDRKRFGNNNREAVKPYCLENIKNDVLSVFEDL